MACLQKSKNKYFVDVIVQKQFVFKEYSTVELYFEEIQYRNLTAKNWLSILYSLVTAQGWNIHSSFNFRWLFLQGSAKMSMFRDFWM